MADIVFNISFGIIKYYASLPAASDAFLCVLLKATGLQADATLRDHDNLDVLLLAANDECDFTNYGRKTITSGIVATVDDVNERLDIDIGDQTWLSAGGAANNSIGALLFCYDPDTGAGDDTTVVPLTKHDFVVTTDGSDLTAQIAATGFFRAQ